MRSNSEILKEAYQRFQDALSCTDWWRTNEVRDNYNLDDGDQWLEDDVEKQNNDGMPVRTINRVSPLLDAVCGFEVQNRTKCEFIPRLPQQQKEGYSDLLNDSIGYIQDASEVGFHNSAAFRDLLKCGVGCTKTIVNYDNDPDGCVMVKRIFPYFVLWDIAAREKNLKDANWVAYAKIVDTDTLNSYLKDEDAEDVEGSDAEFGIGSDARFLDFFNTVMTVKNLSVIYEYEWREKVTFYRVENPFIEMLKMDFDPEDERAQNIVALARTLQEQFKFNPDLDRIFSIDKESHQSVKEAFNMAGLPFKATKQKKYKYFRANIIGNKVIDKEENFSQTSFSIKFMTGKFSEIRQCFYGIVRACKEPQRLLNQSLSDFEGFLRTIPKGGVFIEKNAVSDMKGFINTYTKAREVTIVNDGTLQNGKMMPKPTPPIPSGLLDMINLSIQCIMEVTGVTPDFMGITDSKLMTAQLNSQLVRQGLTVLSTYFDAKKQYIIEQGRLFIDCVRVLAENNEGRLIRVLDKGTFKYIPLLKEGIAADYDIIVEEIPETPDDRQRIFDSLVQLQGILATQPNPPNIAPMMLDYLNLKESQKEEIRTLMQPPPPPEPDPVSQELLIQEAEYKKGLAFKAQNDGLKSQMDVLLKQQELDSGDNKNEAEIAKILSDVQLNIARSYKENNPNN